MSEVKVRWTQRAAGRDEGHEEVVELTPFIEGCVANGRLEIVEHVAPPSRNAGLAEGVTIPDDPPEPRIPRQRRLPE